MSPAIRCEKNSTGRRRTCHIKEGVGDRAELALEGGQPPLLDERGDELHREYDAQRDDKGQQQVVVLAGQQVVGEHARKCRGQYADDGRDQRGEGDECERAAHAVQALLGKLDDRTALSVRNEVFARAKGQADARKRAVELLPIDGDAPAVGVVDDGLAAAEAAQHHKVYKVPMQDAGKDAPPFSALPARCGRRAPLNRSCGRP